MTNYSGGVITVEQLNRCLEHNFLPPDVSEVVPTPTPLTLDEQMEEEFHNPVAVALEVAGYSTLAMRYERADSSTLLSEQLSPEERLDVCRALEQWQAVDYEPKLQSDLMFVRSLCMEDAVHYKRGEAIAGEGRG